MNIQNLKAPLIPSFILAFALSSLCGVLGCGDPEEPATPEQREELRQQHMQRSERERQEG